MLAKGSVSFCTLVGWPCVPDQPFGQPSNFQQQHASLRFDGIALANEDGSRKTESGQSIVSTVKAIENSSWLVVEASS